MAVVINTEECTGCGSCIDECPTELLVLGDDGIIKLTDADECTDCGSCVSECPQECLSV
jgi:NAD-dependent dihydropyrimidine dehydrogenase PreA subunit